MCSFSGLHNNQKKPLTDAQSGIEVLKVLHACQSSIEQNGANICERRFQY